jgi:low temperature requirement protein LtrA
MPRHSHLRDRASSAGHRVSPMELFFDLVFVFAVTQLSHYLLEHHTLAGAAQTLIMFLAVWWAWVYTAWATNWLDPDRPPVRLMLSAVMLLSLVMSSAIPAAFGDYGLAFALAYVAIQAGRTPYTAWARGEWESGASKSLVRATLYFIAAAPLWIAGGLDSDPARRLAWWAAALAVEYTGPFLFFAVPGFGRVTAQEWDISGAHMAERCALFIIISLGEGILVTGATFAELEPSRPAILAFLSAFLASVAMWWTYAHIPIVAGIVVLAVADEQVLVHPTGHSEPFLVASLLGGAFLFIGGTMLFKRMTSGQDYWPLSHLAGLGLFALYGGWAVLAHPEPLLLHAVATVLFIVIAVWEWGSFHGGWVERWSGLRKARGKSG